MSTKWYKVCDMCHKRIEIPVYRRLGFPVFPGWIKKDKIWDGDVNVDYDFCGAQCLHLYIITRELYEPWLKRICC